MPVSISTMDSIDANFQIWEYTSIIQPVVMDQMDQKSSRKIKTVAVFAGSGANVADIYREHAFELGKVSQSLPQLRVTP